MLFCIQRLCICFLSVGSKQKKKAWHSYHFHFTDEKREASCETKGVAKTTFAVSRNSCMAAPVFVNIISMSRIQCSHQWNLVGTSQLAS